MSKHVTQHFTSLYLTHPLLTLNPVQEMLRDTVTNLLLLDPEEIARQITLNSFEVFKKIRPVEYVTDLFGLKSGYGQDIIEVSAARAQVEV